MLPTSQPSPLNLSLAVIADDLTGAADTAAQFCPKAGPALLLLRDAKTPDPAVPAPRTLAITSSTRHARPGAAARRVAHIADTLASCEVNRFYKKIDSCLRGNIGAEVDALLDHLQMQASFIAPAYPAMGRVTAEGIHRVGGIPVNQSEAGRDPRSPVKDACLVRIVAAQSRHATAHISLSTIEAGKTALHGRIDALLQQGVRHIVFDSLNQGHLDRIAEAALFDFQRVLPVGSAGLAASIATLMTSPPTPSPFLPAQGTLQTILFVCGSSSRILRAQADRLISQYRLTDLELSTGEVCRLRPYQRILEKCRSSVGKGRNHILIRIEAVEKAGVRWAPEKVVAGLAEWAWSMMKTEGPDGLFLSGGDTAEAVLSRLGAHGIWLAGQAPEGVIHGRIVGGAAHGLSVFTKAGAFGPPTLLTDFYRLMQKESGS